jgi:outer membrane protein assembly factor BamC
VSILFKRSLRLALTLGGIAWLASCSSIISTGKVDYKSNNEVKTTPLEVPPDLSQLTRDTRFVIPAGSSVSASSLPGMQAGLRRTVSADSIADVQFQRLGSQRWLRVERPVEKVWDQVRGFWLSTGFSLTLDNAELGLLETEWAENRAKLPQDFIRRTIGRLLEGLYSTGERDKYRIRVERVNDQATEIFVTHRGMEEVYNSNDKTSTRWQPRPSDPSLEIEMLRRLMIQLGATEEMANQSTVVTATPASLAQWTQGQSTILFADRFDVAWRRTSVALDRAGFTVEDRDRKAGVFYVRYVDRPDEGKEPGFFSRLFSSASAQPPVRMRISVQEQGASSTRITIQNESGKDDNGAVAQKIARLIHDELK